MSEFDGLFPKKKPKQEARIIRGLPEMTEFFDKHGTIASQLPRKLINDALFEGFSWECYTCATVALEEDLRGTITEKALGILRVDAVACCRKCNSYCATLVDVTPTMNDFTIYQHPNVEARARYTQRRRGLEL